MVLVTFFTKEMYDQDNKISAIVVSYRTGNQALPGGATPFLVKENGIEIRYLKNLHEALKKIGAGEIFREVVAKIETLARENTFSWHSDIKTTEIAEGVWLGDHCVVAQRLGHN